MPLLPLLEMIDEDSYILEVETDLQKYWRSKFLFYAEKLAMITGYGLEGDFGYQIAMTHTRV